MKKSKIFRIGSIIVNISNIASAIFADFSESKVLSVDCFSSPEYYQYLVNCNYLLDEDHEKMKRALFAMKDAPALLNELLQSINHEFSSKISKEGANLTVIMAVNPYNGEVGAYICDTEKEKALDAIESYLYKVAGNTQVS